MPGARSTALCQQGHHANGGRQVQRWLALQGPNAAAVVSYDYVNPSGGHLHQDDAEVWKVENGQIVSLTIYFDITEFRGFMGR